MNPLNCRLVRKVTVRFDCSRTTCKPPCLPAPSHNPNSHYSRQNSSYRRPLYKAQMSRNILHIHAPCREHTKSHFRKQLARQNSRLSIHKRQHQHDLYQIAPSDLRAFASVVATSRLLDIPPSSSRRAMAERGSDQTQTKREATPTTRALRRH